jgi:hypothetical protein
MADEPARETRTCSKCGQEDTDPHHVQYTAFVHPVTGEAQDLSISKHVDCCAEDGCPICATDQKFAQEADQHLREFMLVPNTDEHKRELFEKHGIESDAYQYPDMGETTNG